MIRAVMESAGAELAGCTVLLFGSRASGHARPRSDFDIGLLSEGLIPLKTFYQIEDRLEELPTLYQIDWVDLNRASPQLRRAALAGAKVLYEGKAPAR